MTKPAPKLFDDPFPSYRRKSNRNTRSPGRKRIPMTDDQITANAADLAERIVDEVSSSEQNWPAIEQMANVLAEIAARAAPPITARDGPAPDR